MDRWLAIAVSCFGLILSGLVQASGNTEVDRYEAYLLIYTAVTPDQLTPDDMPRVELFDLRNRLVAGEDGLVWLEPLGDGHRYRALAQVNDDTEFELGYRNGEYFVQMERASSGRRAVFRLYPLERLGLAYFREQRIGQREMLWDRAMVVGESFFTSCNASYRREGDAVLAVYYDQTGLRDTREILSQQGDQLVLAAEGDTEEAYGRTLEYALADDHSTRFLIRLDRGDPADYGNSELQGYLNRVYECLDDGRGHYQPPPPMQRWLQERWREQRGRQDG